MDSAQLKRDRDHRTQRNQIPVKLTGQHHESRCDDLRFGSGKLLIGADLGTIVTLGKRARIGGSMRTLDHPLHRSDTSQAESWHPILRSNLALEHLVGFAFVLARFGKLSSRSLTLNLGMFSALVVTISPPLLMLS